MKCDLLALGGMQFLSEPMGDPECNFNEVDKEMFDEQVRQYIEATLQLNLKEMFTKETDAADGFAKLLKTYKINYTQKKYTKKMIHKN